MIKKFIKLMMGGVGAQVILLLSYPLIIATYSSSQFGVFSVFFACSMLISPFFYFKFDLKLHAYHTTVSVKRAFAKLNLCAVIFLTFLLMCASLLYILDAIANIELIVFILMMSLFVGAQNSLHSLLLREGFFLQLNLVKLLTNLLVVVLQIFIFNEFENGLILGYLIAYLFLFIFFLTKIPLEVRVFKSLLYACYSFKTLKFPIFASLANTASLQLMPILIASFKASKVVGVFSLGQKLTSAPISLLCAPLSQVFISEASALKRRKKNIKNLFFKTILIAFLFLALPLLICSIWIESIALSLLPGDWTSVASYLPYLFYVAAVQSLVNPIATYPVVISQEHLILKMDLIRLSLVTASTLLSFLFLPDDWLIVYTLSSVFSYLIYLTYYTYDILKTEGVTCEFRT